MAKCKNCRNNTTQTDESSGRMYNWCPIIDDCPDPERERNCKHYKTMTSADWIQSMTDEELEDFLFHIGVNCALCHEKGGCESHRFCDDETLEEWLQSQVEV